MGPITTRNNFVFDSNRLPKLFAGPHEMTRPLRAKIGLIGGAVELVKLSRISVRHLVFS